MLVAQRVLFSVVAAFWIAVGVLAFAGAVTFGMDQGAPMVGAMLLVNGAALAVAGWCTARGRRWIDWLAIALVAANAVTSLLDEAGVLDIVSAVVNAGLLVLLVANVRREGRPTAQAPARRHQGSRPSDP